VPGNRHPYRDQVPSIMEIGRQEEKFHISGMKLSFRKGLERKGSSCFRQALAQEIIPPRPPLEKGGEGEFESFGRLDLVFGIPACRQVGIEKPEILNLKSFYGFQFLSGHFGLVSLGISFDHPFE